MGLAFPVNQRFRFSSTLFTAVILCLVAALACVGPVYGAKDGHTKEFLKAVRQGKAEKAAELVSRVSSQDAVDGLREAARLGHLNVVQALVGKGVDVDGGIHSSSSATQTRSSDWGAAMMCAGGSTGPTTPLVAAISGGKLEVVTWLVEHKANVNLQSDACLFEDVKQGGGLATFRVVSVGYAGNTPLSDAVLYQQTSIFKFLAEHGADFSRRVVYQSASVPGFVGFAGGGGLFGVGGVLVQEPDGTVQQRPSVRLVIGQDGEVTTNLTIQMQEESTVGDLALRSTLPEIRNLAKAYIGTAGGSGDIFDAAGRGDLERVKAILAAHPELVSSKDTRNATPLHWAVGAGHKEVAELLLANKADVNARGNQGVVPLDLAAAGGLKDIAELLLTNKADVNAKTELGSSPLHYAAARGKKDVVEVLLANGADVTAKDNEGGTPLHQASAGGFKDVVELLLAKKADVNASGSQGFTPLHTAAVYGHTEVAELLVAGKVEVDAKDKEGETALARAAQHGSDGVAQLLLANNADVNARDKRGLTPLHLAVFGEHRKTAELLLANKADANAKADKNLTPLHLAAAKGNKDLATMLLANGADANAQDETGKTPMRAASERGKMDVVELLRQHGGHE